MLLILTGQPQVRLAGGSTPNEGRVEVFYNGVWEQSVMICGVLKMQLLFVVNWDFQMLVLKPIHKLTLDRDLEA